MTAKQISTTVRYFSFILLSSISTYGQSKFAGNNDIFGRRVFIENKGQFDKILPNNPIIDYVYSKENEQVFFNKQGVTYFLEKKYPMSHEQHEAMEHGKKVNLKPSKKAFVNVSWENSNPNVELVVSEKQTYYQSFGDEKHKSDCYKKITYKNIYNNIDIEYLFTNEREDGIKYNVILHPGAHVEDIKIKYTGDVNKVALKKGNVIIKTPVLNITELAPISFQEGAKIESAFKIKDNIISFTVNNYDHTKDLTIDPWVVNIALASNSYAFDVDYDYSGNLYVFGGSGPFLISKFSSTGTLLWTFSGSVPSIGWSSTPQGIILASNFIIDKVSGKVYTGQGWIYGGTRIIRLNTAGIYDNFVSIANNNWEEVWDMGYRCSDGAIIGMGGGTIDNTSAGILNTTTGVILPQSFTGGINDLSLDVVSHAIDPSGDIFIIYASASTPNLSNKIVNINATFNGNDWVVPSLYNSFDEQQNKNYPGATTLTYFSNGSNALAANSTYLYYYDGYNLAAYNKLTGSRIAYTTIAGQSPKQQGGIAVDECNNIYIGGKGFILCYNFNGTTFTANGTIPVATITTNKYVTDIKLNSNELYACGNGFAGIYSAINSLSCSGNASISISQTTISTNNTTAVATVTTSVTTPTINYTWLNSSNTIVSQTTNSTSLTNTVLNLTNGTYTVLVQLNAPCGLSTTQTFTISNATIFTPLFTQVAAICSGAPLLALPTTSNNGITGSWAPALNNTQTTTYTFTPDTGQNATTTTMIITVNQPTIPTFTAANSICSGATLTALPTTSNNSITGTWSPALNNIQTTPYTFTPTTGICATTATLTITVNQPTTPTFTAVNPICSGATLTALPTTSNNSITGTWSPALNNTQTTLYTFTPTTGICATTATLTITVNQSITPTFTAIGPICFGDIVPTLPTTSLNLIAGTWQPAIISNMLSGDYQFTPNLGECANLPPSVSVTVYDRFDFEITGSCVDKNFILQVIPLSESFDINTASISWYNSNNTVVNSNSTTFNVTEYLTANSIIPHLPITFNATIELPNGCTNSHNKIIDELFCGIQKGISPNDDTLNDFFNLELLDVKKLSIFNRYGMKVYSKLNYTNQWTGKSDSGKELPDGTYYYVIEFNLDKPTVTGWIYLNREQ